MPYPRPSLSQLIARIKQDIKDRTEGGDSFLARSVEYVLALVVAGVAHGLYGYLAWVAKQIVPNADMDEAQIAKWLEFEGLSLNDAAKATGTATWKGVNSTVMPTGTTVQALDGTEYKVTADATVTGGTVTATLLAVETGADGNLDAGATVRLASPIPGIDSDGLVDDDGNGNGLAGGRNRETVAEAFIRLLVVKNTPQLGGGPGDYRDWALEISGVTRAWEVPAINGPGSVGVYVVDDTLPDITNVPTSVTDAVTENIEAKSPVVPTGATLVVDTPTALPVNITASIVPNTVAVQEAAEAELADLFKTAAELGGTIQPSIISEAISRATGETSHDLTSPAADVVAAGDEIPTLGTVTWS